MKKMLKNALDKYLALFLVLVIITGVCLLFSSRKSGMFIDEIYTYGLSNSDHAPFLSDIKNGDMIGKTFTREELLDYVMVDDDEGFDVGSVYYNQANDVHPPLYYWIFNAASTLERGSFSKWTGLKLDLLLYLVTVILLWKLSLRLFDSRFIAAAVTILYGVSILGTSTMLMIRMYVLLTLLTVWLAYLVTLQLTEPSWKPAILTGVCIFLGLMTQYYFVFYAFFLCAFYVVHRLVNRQFKEALRFSLCAFAGVGLLLIVFPYCLTHLFADKLVSGGNAVENLTAFSQYAFRFSRFIGETRHGLKAAILVALAAAVLLLVFSRKLRLQVKLGSLRFDSLLIILPAYITFVVVTIISPVDEVRYIYNIAPILVLTVGFLLYLLDKALWVYNSDRIRYAALALIAALAVWEARCAPPAYLYPEYVQYDALVSEHSASPCVYFNDNEFSSMTQDLQQLLFFKDVYVTDKEHFDAFTDYVGNSDEFVAYFDISEFWGSGYKPEEIIPQIAAATEYKNVRLLYENGLSCAYIISK